MHPYDAVIASLPNIARDIRSHGCESGMKPVKSRTVPAAIMHPERMLRRPHRSRVKMIKVYAGISTAPEMTKERR